MPTLTAALFDACAKGDEQAVRSLLQSGAKANARTIGRLTPLMVAGANGHARVIILLLEAKANVGSVDENRLTALHHAASSVRFCARQRRRSTSRTPALKVGCSARRGVPVRARYSAEHLAA